MVQQKVHSIFYYQPLKVNTQYLAKLYHQLKKTSRAYAGQRYLTFATMTHSMKIKHVIKFPIALPQNQKLQVIKHEPTTHLKGWWAKIHELQQKETHPRHLKQLNSTKIHIKKVEHTTDLTDPNSNISTLIPLSYGIFQINHQFKDGNQYLKLPLFPKV